MALSSAGMISIDQVAVVVRDLDAAMERYVTHLGIGPWAIYTLWAASDADHDVS